MGGGMMMRVAVNYRLMMSSMVNPVFFGGFCGGRGGGGGWMGCWMESSFFMERSLGTSREEILDVLGPARFSSCELLGMRMSGGLRMVGLGGIGMLCGIRFEGMVKRMLITGGGECRPMDRFVASLYLRFRNGPKKWCSIGLVIVDGFCGGSKSLLICSCG